MPWAQDHAALTGAVGTFSHALQSLVRIGLQAINSAVRVISRLVSNSGVVADAVAIDITVGLQFALSGYFGDPCTGPLHFP